MPRITLSLSRDGWIAIFNGDANIQKLFGCTVLPTPFTALASPEHVLAKIRAINPGCVVELA